MSIFAQERPLHRRIQILRYSMKCTLFPWQSRYPIKPLSPGLIRALQPPLHHQALHRPPHRLPPHIPPLPFLRTRTLPLILLSRPTRPALIFLFSNHHYLSFLPNLISRNLTTPKADPPYPKLRTHLGIPLVQPLPQRPKQEQQLYGVWARDLECRCGREGIA